MFGVKFAIAGAGHANGNGLGKDMLKDVAGAAGMVVGGHHNYAVPVLFGDQGPQGLSLFAGIVGIVWKTDDAVLGDAALDQVVFHQFGDACAGTQAAAAGHDDGRQFLAIQLGGAGGPVGKKIIVAEEQKRVRLLERILDDPGFAGQPKQRAPGSIKYETKNDQEKQADQTA